MIFTKSIVAVLLSISAAAAMYIYWPKSDSVTISEIPSSTTPMIPMAPMPEPSEPMPKPEHQPSDDSNSPPIATAAIGTAGLILLASILERGIVAKNG
jgi:outer membrane biosynthesis protein TonB